MKNSFSIVTELTYTNGTDEFRPDITPLFNGVSLSFVEVKKPNSKDGIKAAYDRMNTCVQNKKFRRFINLTQIMVFSNNSPYDDNEVVPLEGAFYALSCYEKLFFNHFRDEDLFPVLSHAAARTAFPSSADWQTILKSAENPLTVPESSAARNTRTETARFGSPADAGGFHLRRRSGFPGSRPKPARRKKPSAARVPPTVSGLFRLILHYCLASKDSSLRSLSSRTTMSSSLA